jgi:tRNA(Ile)-lysidine synthase
MDAVFPQSDLPEQLAAMWAPAAWSGVHVLAAVSGGADSMALLRAMLDVKQASDGAGRMYAAHVNHQLRGAASDEDEAWLRAECERLGVPLLVRRANAGVDEGDGKRSAAGGEAFARELRYRHLRELAEEVGARYVALAHTRDDQVETVLFRILRGSGLRGLAGMPRTRPLAPSVALVRPLLDCSRAAVRVYLHAIGQTWREDATNADVRFARNRLRHETLPHLREQFDVDGALARLAEQAADAQAVIDIVVDRLLASCDATADAASVVLATQPLADQPAAIVAEALRALWRRAGWPEQAMDCRSWTALAELAQAFAAGGSLNLPGDILARRRAEQLVLARRKC